MKIKYPVSYKLSGYKTESDYMNACLYDLSVFRSILKSNINVSRWDAITDRLYRSKLIKSNRKVKAVKFAYQFINSLQCKYDHDSGSCYYSISPFINGVGTFTKLDSIIRYIEFGFDDIQPMNWIRHSLLVFSERLSQDEKE